MKILINYKSIDYLMSFIKVSNFQFQFIVVLLKYISSSDDFSVTADSYEIDFDSLKSFILKRAIIPIEIKNNLLKSFSEIIFSLSDEIFSNSNNVILITKNQICSLIKPIITNAAINPIDKQKLSQFFQNFSCQSEKDEFFLSLIDF